MSIFLFSVTLSLFGISIISEKYFFDKFYYQKSYAHGYFDCAIDCTYKYLGKRSKDLYTFFENTSNNKVSPDILGKNSDTFTVALIGDSFVWGPGVRVHETLFTQLEKRLNKIRKTRVYAFGWPGDSALDNLAKYEHIKKVLEPDVYIFILVENDLLIKPTNDYHSDVYDQIIAKCENRFGKIINNSESNKPGYDYNNLISRTFQNHANKCTLELSAERYPRTNAIYLLTNDYFSWSKPHMESYRALLKPYDLNILSTYSGKSIPQYTKYFDDVQRWFRVSKIENHPSGLAYALWAEILARELLNMPELGFVEM